MLTWVTECRRCLSEPSIQLYVTSPQYCIKRPVLRFLYFQDVITPDEIIKLPSCTPFSSHMQRNTPTFDSATNPRGYTNKWTPYHIHAIHGTLVPWHPTFVNGAKASFSNIPSFLCENRVLEQIHEVTPISVHPVTYTRFMARHSEETLRRLDAKGHRLSRAGRWSLLVGNRGRQNIVEKEFQSMSCFRH